MTPAVNLPVEERIGRLFKHLGIEKAHFAASVAIDWESLATRLPQMISSLTLVCPQSISPHALDHVASRLLVVSGDQGRSAETTKAAVAGLPKGILTTLKNYSPQLWSDIASERSDEVGSAMIEFLRRAEQVQPSAQKRLSESEGEIAGISYRVRGSGPPLALMPLGLAPTQWDALLPRLSERYCTILLGGAELGFVARLEERGRTGYVPLVQRFTDLLGLRPGEEVLDVGCGSGIYDRLLAARTGGANRIVAVDVNQYMLREAAALAKREGLEAAIEFREGHAESLPFPDGSFDVTMSCTVMEEVDADKMLAEMVRVTRPGGRIGVIVRAVDMPTIINAPLPAALRSKLENQRGPVAERGCADRSLYSRFRRAGITDVHMFPYLAIFDSSATLYLQTNKAQAVAGLSPDEAKEWHAAVSQAEAEGTFFFAQPLHCAVGQAR